MRTRGAIQLWVKALDEYIESRSLRDIHKTRTTSPDSTVSLHKVLRCAIQPQFAQVWGCI